MVRSRRAKAGAALAVVCAVALGWGSTGAATSVAGVAPVAALAPAVDDVLEELESRRSEVQGEREDVGAEVDALTADVDDALAELDRRQARAAQAERDAVAAQRAADEAAGVAARSSSSADLATSAFVEARQRARAVAVERYVAGPDLRGLDALLRGDVFAGATIDVVLEAVVSGEQQIAGSIAEAATVLAGRRDAASAATTRAQRLAEAAVRARVEAETARQEYLSFVTDLQARLDHTLAEAASLEALDADLADRIRRREIELARRLPPRPPGGGFSVGTPVPIEQTVVAAGFRVHASIAPQVEAMVAAAAADGVILGGGAYRDGSAQIALRRAHCGETDYDIWERPPSECRPPTARPTQSMHEQGLALDLSTPAGLIVTRLDPAYQWLIVHAEAYGFFNLPSEPWHWSTNGR